MKSMNTQSNFNWYFNRKNRVAYYIFHNKGILAVDMKKKTTFTCSNKIFVLLVQSTLPTIFTAQFFVCASRF